PLPGVAPGRRGRRPLRGGAVAGDREPQAGARAPRHALSGRTVRRRGRPVRASLRGHDGDLCPDTTTAPRWGAVAATSGGGSRRRFEPGGGNLVVVNVIAYGV